MFRALLPYRAFCIETELAASDVLARLRTAVAQPNEPLSWDLDRRLVWSRVEPDSFEFTLTSAYGRNAWVSLEGRLFCAVLALLRLAFAWEATGVATRLASVVDAARFEVTTG